MENLQGKVAFITGGASGIGLGIAKACAKHGMKVVVADARQEALDEALKWFKENNYPARTIKLDVTDRPAYERAADEAEAAFGKIHVLINNAGVAAGSGPMQEASFKDWDFIVGVNITGVFNGIKIILPRILKHGEGGHVVSTASKGGLITVGMSGLYCTTKYAVAGMMETLATDLQGTNVGASAFCPGPVTSNLGFSSAQVRPAGLKNDSEKLPPPPPPGSGPMPDWSKIFMSPEEVGERVVRGIRRGDLFILTHPEFREGLIARNEAILRAVPDEPLNVERKNVLKTFGSLIYNPVYDTQTQVGPPDWE
ncbi:NADP-dependent 3-hydroxy acid dehydrogenase YdfG [Sporobacter termitidis DSM 10068]|uniref:NADP-dependent 3-hydroxy acid dehydrogenase YdfG n=1 Tax=Sporobacter termitidis DSM 10068 TaxID=1123282 RepID=A0A1M5VGA8_9FIRM|nr:SDR family NAD(P)-dependent oxidoreductase [Sporobacter termitidis]SHH74205.1 NADP-dependent 3-hydroxy acid dehydrogenase YdfG [Sporobacter termitidis DSM 10068]